jgi:predicted permease
LAATGELPVGLGTGGATERQRALAVSGNYFAMLGITPALGRTFASDEGVEIDDASVVVLSHGLWRRRFGADPAIIGRSVTINGRVFTVIGVTPREFAGTTRSTIPDLYIPITLYGQLTGPLQGGEHPLRTRFFTWHQILGRLKDGVTHEQAQVAMQALTDQFNQNPAPNTPERIVVRPGAQGFTQDLREARLPLHLLLGTACLVLLVACANLANLPLARATGRARDYAIRLALGAGRLRLVRELLAESLGLAIVGGGIGVLVARGLVKVLERFQPAEGTIEVAGGLDSRLLVFTVAVSIVTGVLFGLAPALRASRPQLIPELKGGGGTTESRHGPWSLRSALVVTQVSLSLVVLVGAGLCVRSLKQLQQVDPGFEPSRVVVMSFDLGLNNYPPPRVREFYAGLLDRIRGLPGVESASLGLTTPLSGRAPAMSVERLEGYQQGPQEHPFGDFNIVANDYFRTLGIRIAQGRDFTAHDGSNTPPVVIINEAFAQRYWPGQNPIGKRLFQHGPGGGTATEVVGVVGATRANRMTDAPRPAFYFPLGQKSDSALTLAVKSGLDPGVTIDQVRREVSALDAAVPVFGVRTLAQQKDGALALQRMAATLLSGFGVLALLLAALGIYGVLAYSVSRRTREIGVRMALGARLSDVVGMVVRQGVGMVAVGLAAGLAGAAGVTHLLRAFLFGITPLDPVTFGIALGLLAGVAVLACWLPARRAARVDPIQALRAE